MKLEEQIYKIQYWKKIENVSHTELLWDNKQIIRFQEYIFDKADSILNNWNELSLYNHYNPINIDLIRNYKKKKELFNWAIIAKIIWSKNNQPIIEWKSLKQVEVTKMSNIYFEDISNEDLKKSLIESNEYTVNELIKWLSYNFYNKSYSIKDIIKLQKLFFRQIKLK